MHSPILTVSSLASSTRARQRLVVSHLAPRG
jgi:hypothetical protein